MVGGCVLLAPLSGFPGGFEDRSGLILFDEAVDKNEEAEGNRAEGDAVNEPLQRLSSPPEGGYI